MGIFSLIIFSLKISGDNKGYIEAMNLANKKMERIRNMSYDDVGTTPTVGVPGPIPQTEIITKSNEYTVYTDVSFEDDPYDSTAGSTSPDTIWDDYKIVTIKVSWQSNFGQKDVTVFSKVIPRTEEIPSGNGLLKLFIIDANNNPFPGANVKITDTVGGGFVDRISDANGLVVESVVPAEYEVLVTKAGYGTDKTHPITAENPNPSKRHLTATAGNKREESFQIDLLSNLEINTISQGLPNNWQSGDSDTAGTDQTNSRIAFDSAGYVYTVWQDYRVSNKPKIYAQKYNPTSGGQWPNTISPSDQEIANASDTVLPDIKIDSNGNLYAAWHDQAVGNREAYLISLNSSNGSNRWGGEKKINTDGADNYNQEYIRLTLLNQSSNATTTVVWQDNRNTDSDIFIQQYDYINGNPIWTTGHTVSESEIRVIDLVASDGFNQYDGVIQSDSNDNFYVGWTDERDGDLNIYAAKFDRNGNPLWGGSNVRMTTNGGSTNQYMAELAVDSSNNPYITWTDERDGNKNIYLAKYNPVDGSQTWEIKVNSNTNTTDQYSSSFAIDTSDNIYIAWTDEREGNPDIYAQKIDISGTKLWTDDVRVNISLGTSNEYNPSVTIDVSTAPDTPYVTWESNVNGDNDIFISSFEEYGSVTNIPNIDLNVTGTKKIGDNPVIYEYNKDLQTDTNGELDIQVEWDNPGYTITASSSVYELIFCQPTMPIDLLPGVTKEINLYLK